jgi:hypothetical protein
MINLQIQLLLEEAHRKNFLDRAIFLKENEREYKQSDFYKRTKIDILDLYESFYTYYNREITLAEKINNVIQEIDLDEIYEKIKQIIDFIFDQEKVKNFIDYINNEFDFNKLLEENEEIKDTLKNFFNDKGIL